MLCRSANANQFESVCKARFCEQLLSSTAIKRKNMNEIIDKHIIEIKTKINLDRRLGFTQIIKRRNRSLLLTQVIKRRNRSLLLTQVIKRRNRSLQRRNSLLGREWSYMNTQVDALKNQSSGMLLL